MNQENWLKILEQNRIIAVLRASEIEIGMKMAKAVAAGGIRIIEITWNSHKASELITLLRSELPTCIIGTGTLLTIEELQKALKIGCKFIFTPHTNPAMIQTAKIAAVPIIPGALSPTEILTAWQAGASCVKIYPISAVGGATYITSLQGPLGEIPLIPTGGVTLENAKEFIKAGAIAVGLSGKLFPKDLIIAQNWEAIARQTQALVRELSANN
ncbi:MAG: bifunctional 4-hydroxy-2-oxoglutarate aldolase/2-dehydro-3-deoxy-phosphogluconate aldolase [Okeania sp. SIO2G4]|uniref:bifunctional 4-hydroxy-2-oxoglutarate aldolase/2-dehydro-3-deoxy-phosphogluconate aldolase n=1 Tax=unclassified Okeania TaxID=2634635 RepID=UPI0013B94C09|nr:MULTISPECIES: bifunctional 4-hydroxy-2-oxoglutarate aldolase/2-dehydro-3-deoxy-phosphogluconate aldolase [unclassified Okeania]NEP39674.1 bifunctional 4-hydroxy-2-oxoglutarate aldolase/2-dehydro-3-deoxy-phosphogluconate aldolase [Okeania sp. SIO2H7]NEP71313.1 bifunctional 4-hydroxy-2-oxoglutarate aldolase/2-dehydro-3-deoxy-phosphogluconate aldolase [Okeania sp. SIO2G5]NEP91993.1 bifunctional 4-hydroxy-2-oxoglutarate aldolase/2-dehydro-3-deoxy-phosphogluconate aldolase [Okeania sp. SIO2F5]NEQ